MLFPDGCTINPEVGKQIKEGKVEVFDKNSSLYAILYYHNDKLNGICEFYDNGILNEKISYLDNEEEGWGCEMVNGKESKWYLYRNGEKYSELVELLNGMREERLLKSGEILNICSYDENHKKTGMGYLFNNNRISSIVVFDDGKMIRTIKSFDKKEMSVFNENGELVYKGGFLNNMDKEFPCEGRGKEYKEGEIVYDGHYHINNREGKGKSYMNGKLAYDGEWKDNKPNGYGKLYDKKEKSLHEGTWKKGKLETFQFIVEYSDEGISKKSTEEDTVLSLNIPVSKKKRDRRKSLLVYLIGFIVFMILVGCIVALFLWLKTIESVNNVSSQIEFDKLSNYSKHIKFVKESCNEDTFVSLDFSRFKNLRSIEVEDFCMMYVQNVKIDGLSKLETVDIGKNAFTQHANSYSKEEQSKSFALKNCAALKSVTMNRYSFSDYNSFIVESKMTE